MHPDAGDRGLLDRLIAGDENALGEIYAVYSPLVYGIARRVCGDDGAASDITQEVFVGLWSQPTRFEPGRGTLRAYLGTIAHRRAVDWVRSESRRNRRNEAVGSEAVRDHELDVDPIEAGVVRTDLSDRVRRAVAALPPDQWQAVRLAYFGGHTYREVAAVLGIPEGTAKSRLRLALARLQDLLTREGVMP